MPIYEIQHIIPLTPQQEDGLAESITRIHSTKFTTPRMFVQVKYTDCSNVTTYIGGKRRQGNHIIANVRVGPSRTQSDWDDLCRQVLEAWNHTIAVPGAKGDLTLRSCIILGGMTAGYEAGFLLPKAGDDVKWLGEHIEEFEMKAKAGDEEFQELVEEVKERGLLDGVNGKSSKQRLEEMLGWGDSA
ncbi:hypothetical protein AC579_854 [Pseudocercospora musae]|uniref:Tautomerase cis-CaaD-like domain-containing protein n=1 Tax=Pseudocercospora musae TaxID=113226 RepID=A0A139HI98_9PEZI|nr:hypothetical protein AC579_854 [Pseudocercospora musae]